MSNNIKYLVAYDSPFLGLAGYPGVSIDAKNIEDARNIALQFKLAKYKNVVIFTDENFRLDHPAYDWEFINQHLIESYEN